MIIYQSHIGSLFPACRVISDTFALLVSAMEHLDSDDGLLRIDGRVAERDIVQVHNALVHAISNALGTRAQKIFCALAVCSTAQVPRWEPAKPSSESGAPRKRSPRRDSKPSDAVHEEAIDQAKSASSGLPTEQHCSEPNRVATRVCAHVVVATRCVRVRVC